MASRPRYGNSSILVQHFINHVGNTDISATRWTVSCWNDNYSSISGFLECLFRLLSFQVTLHRCCTTFRAQRTRTKFCSTFPRIFRYNVFTTTIALRFAFAILIGWKSKSRMSHYHLKRLFATVCVKNVTTPSSWILKFVQDRLQSYTYIYLGFPQYRWQPTSIHHINI